MIHKMMMKENLHGRQQNNFQMVVLLQKLGLLQGVGLLLGPHIGGLLSKDTKFLLFVHLHATSTPYAHAHKEGFTKVHVFETTCEVSASVFKN